MVLHEHERVAAATEQQLLVVPLLLGHQELAWLWRCWLRNRALPCLRVLPVAAEHRRPLSCSHMFRSHAPCCSGRCAEFFEFKPAQRA